MRDPGSSPTPASITRHSHSSQSQKDSSGCPSAEEIAGDPLRTDVQGTLTSSEPCPYRHEYLPSSAGESDLTHVTHHSYNNSESEEAMPVAEVEGGYLYNPAIQERLPLQAVPSATCTPVAYCGYSTSRRCCMILFLVVFCFLLVILTILLVVIFVALEPAPHL
ncbi:hypothetical protein ACOMHN_034759 [Nucella lapillus]